MVYDRYAGMVSLPGADGKMPRPFRVDENGNVIYLDEERSAARRKASKQARSGIMDWHELDRRLDEERGVIGHLKTDKSIQLAETENSDRNGYKALRAQGQRDGRNLVAATGPGSQSGPEKGEAVGIASRAARVGIESAKVRARYNPQVRQLGPDDNQLRAALKEKLRVKSPWEMRGMLDAVFPDSGPKEGSRGHANKPNERVNRQARVLGRVGKGMGVLGGALAVGDVMRSPNRPRAAVANVGAAIGGTLGGAGGAAAGAATGPLAVVAAPAGGVAGAMAGGNLGYEAGEAAYDYATDLLDYYRRYRAWLN